MTSEFANSISVTQKFVFDKKFMIVFKMAAWYLTAYIDDNGL